MPNINDTPLKIGTKVPTAIYTASDEPVCIVDSMKERTDDADVARRMVVCWNICAGISTEGLEALENECRSSQPLAYELDELSNLRKQMGQRDSLNEALASRNAEIMEQLRAAILGRNALLDAINSTLDAYGLEEGMQAHKILVDARDKAMEGMPS